MSRRFPYCILTGMSKFEDDMQSLERLAADIKRNDITLEEALKDFEEGIKLSKSLEKELESIEGKVMKLMNNPDLDEDDKAKKKAPAKPKSEGPLLDLFTPSGEINGTRNA